MAIDEEISKYRNEVIEKFINLEWLIIAIISQHYFKKVKGNFVFEVLYDEYCSFALKRRILQKIIKDIDDKEIQKLNRLNTIRNYFSHCNIKFTKIKGGEGFIPNPRNPDTSINFKELYDEFIEKEKSVNNYLFKTFKSLGGIVE